MLIFLWAPVKPRYITLHKDGAISYVLKGIRINIVSPTIVTESLEQYGDYFRGYESIPAKHVALAYCKSVEGAQTGQIYKVGW